MVLLYTCGSGRSDRSSSSVSSSKSNISSRSSGSNSSSSSNASINSSSSSSSVSNTSSSSSSIVISSSCTSNSCSTSSRCSSSSSSSSSSCSSSSSISCTPIRLKYSSPLYIVLIGSHVQSFEAWLWRSTKNEKNHWTTVTRSQSILLSETGSTLSEWTNPLW